MKKPLPDFYLLYLSCKIFFLFFDYLIFLAFFFWKFCVFDVIFSFASPN